MQDLKVVVLQRTVVSRFGCFVFEIWVLRASVFVFECFVFETTPSFHGLRKERLAQWPSFWEVHVRNTLLSHIARYLPSFHAINRQRDQNNSIYGISRREYKHFESPSTENCTKNYAQKTKVLNQRAQRHSNHRSVSLESDEYKLWSEKSSFFFIACTTKRIKFSLSRGLSFSLPFWTESCALGKPDSKLFWESKFHFPRVFEGVTPLTRKPKGDKIAN